jgi:hypothetical protein
VSWDLDVYLIVSLQYKGERTCAAFSGLASATSGRLSAAPSYQLNFRAW